jgi:TonB family protein
MVIDLSKSVHEGHRRGNLLTSNRLARGRSAPNITSVTGWHYCKSDNLCSMPEGTQRYERTRMVLPLRVWTDEHAGEATALQLAHTIDISPIGGRLGGLRDELFPGQTIMLQRGQHKAAFRVIWSKHLANHENQAGIEVLEGGKNIWGVELPQSAKTEDNAVHPAPSGESVATAAPRPLAALSMKSPRAARAHRSWIPAVIPRRALWGVSLGLFLASGLLSLSLYREIFSDSGQSAIQVPVPGPPTAGDLARMTPKPRALPAPAERTTPVARMQVAEAPTGRIIYPVAPDDSIGGKVRLQVVIAANGIVKQIHVLSGRQVLAQAAEQAIRFWHYRPFQSEGPPEERETSVIVSFRGTDAVSLEFPSSNRNAQVRAN